MAAVVELRGGDLLGLRRKLVEVLALTLRALEEDFVSTRRVEPTIPPAVYYELTPLGRSLDEPLAVLRDWAETHLPEIDRLRLTERAQQPR